MNAKKQGGIEDVLALQLPILKVRALSLTRNPADAADLVQDTLERALRAAPRLRPESNVPGWLMTIMQRRFIDLARRERLWDHMVRVEACQVQSPPARQLVPWEHLETNHVRRAVERLPPAFATVFRMRVFDRSPCGEIARRLAIPVGTVHTRLMRAREKVRNLLPRSPAPEGCEPEARARPVTRPCRPARAASPS